jgi:hypothetical protein
MEPITSDMPPIIDMALTETTSHKIEPHQMDNCYISVCVQILAFHITLLPLSAVKHTPI